MRGRHAVLSALRPVKAHVARCAPRPARRGGHEFGHPPRVRLPRLGPGSRWWRVRWMQSLEWTVGRHSATPAPGRADPGLGARDRDPSTVAGNPIEYFDHEHLARCPLPRPELERSHPRAPRAASGRAPATPAGADGDSEEQETGHLDDVVPLPLPHAVDRPHPAPPAGGRSARRRPGARTHRRGDPSPVPQGTRRPTAAGSGTRLAARAGDTGEAKITGGGRVLLLPGAANRDPGHPEAPDTRRPGRGRSGHPTPGWDAPARPGAPRLPRGAHRTGGRPATPDHRAAGQLFRERQAPLPPPADGRPRAAGREREHA